MTMKRFVFTCGDINGIGPEISLKTFNRIYNPEKYKLIFIVPKNIFDFYKEKIPPKFDYEIVNTISESNIKNPKVTILNIGNAVFNLGMSTKESGTFSYKAIIKAIGLTYNRKIADAIITAPISKQAFKMAGIQYPGHTELLADKCKIEKFAMMFLSKKFRAALFTIHEPIKNVPTLLTKEKIKNIISVVDKSLRYDFKIENPKIAILGLNPHAGENGEIGSEELNIIIPAIKETNNVNLFGPFVSDAFFANRKFRDFDIVIGMYHDQILIPFKMLNFFSGVNFTAGLPIVRTSPDHGTAFDIAGKNIADSGSLVEAFQYALEICNNRES